MNLSILFYSTVHGLNHSKGYTLQFILELFSEKALPGEKFFISASK